VNDLCKVALDGAAAVIERAISGRKALSTLLLIHIS